MDGLVNRALAGLVSTTPRWVRNAFDGGGPYRTVPSAFGDGGPWWVEDRRGTNVLRSLAGRGAISTTRAIAETLAAEWNA